LLSLFADEHHRLEHIVPPGGLTHSGVMHTHSVNSSQRPPGLSGDSHQVRAHVVVRHDPGARDAGECRRRRIRECSGQTTAPMTAIFLVQRMFGVASLYVLKGERSLAPEALRPFPELPCGLATSIGRCGLDGSNHVIDACDVAFAHQSAISSNHATQAQ
jgi:hypothetical protein